MKLSKGIYAYSILEWLLETEYRAKLPNDTFVIPYRDIAFLVSNAFESNWQPTRKNILKHQKIIAQAQEQFELLPMRFGTVFKNRDEVYRTLENNYREIQCLLNKIRGRVELGLRVFWNHKAFLEEMESQKIDKIKKAYKAGKKDRYLLALEAGKVVEALVLRKRDEYIRKMFEPLCRLADDSLLNPVTGEKMVFNAAFLVKKENFPEFDKKVETLYEENKDKFTFKYSGPWPPYNFAKVSW